MSKENKRLIGIWGYPDPAVLAQVKAEHPDKKLVDLDIANNAPNSGVLPEAYCRIMRNIIDNSLALKDDLELIVASVGKEKCDSGWFAANILKDMGFDVIETKFEEYGNNRKDTPISRSNLLVKDKITAIMDGVIERQELTLQDSEPAFGFWGVPPNDLDFLDVFPNNTHIYGWTRCVEAGRPADLELEMFVDTEVPTVFFAQTFCAKMQLAKYLADKHSGLYVDADDVASRSVKAKIEAFIKLR